MQPGHPEHLLPIRNGERCDGSTYPPPLSVASQNDDLLGVAGGDYVGGMRREDDLQFRSALNLPTQIPHERMLELRVEVRLGFLDEDGHVEGDVREERILDTVPLSLGLLEALCRIINLPGRVSTGRLGRRLVCWTGLG